MDFVNKIKYQQLLVTGNKYVKYLYSELRRDNVIEELDLNEKLKYEESLPIDILHYFRDCNRLVCKFKHDIDFTDVDIEFLITLIYTGLCCEDTQLELESTAVQALFLFLMLKSDRYANSWQLNETVFKSIVSKILDIQEERARLDRKVSTSFMFIWNKFLTANKLNFDLQRLIDAFFMTLLCHITPIAETGDGGNARNSPVARGCFLCFSTIVEKVDHEQQRDITTFLCLKLNDCLYIELLHPHIIDFFKNCLHNLTREDWYYPLLIVLLKEIKNKDLFVRIIHKLPVAENDEIINIIINNFVQAKDEPDIILYLSIMDLLLTIPYQNTPDDRRQRMVGRIMTETLYRSSIKNLVIKERVMELFTSWCQMKDINVRRHIQLMFHNGNRIQASQLFELFLENVDVSWKNPPYNVTFIKFACRIFMLNRPFVNQYRMRILEILCYKATAHCLRPCVPVIIELIRHFALAPHPILKPMIALIVNNILSANTSSTYYMQEFFDLLSSCMVATNDSDVEFSICNTILSDDFNCSELFKTIRLHNFIRTEHINVLLQEKVLKHPCAWKLLSILLDNMEHETFPAYIELYFKKIALPVFFLSCESVHIMQVITKIYAAKIKNNAVTNEDSKLATFIYEQLRIHITELSVPIKQIYDALVLLATLNKVLQTSLDWLKKLFKDTFEFVLPKSQQFPRIPIIRHVAYLEQIFVLHDVDLEEEELSTCFVTMGVVHRNFILHEQIFAGIVSFFGKVCLKYTERTTDGIPLLQHAMINAPAAVQVMAISALYDISNLVLNYYDPLYPGLLVLFKSKTIDVKSMAVKIFISLANNHHVRITCNDFIRLMLVLVDRNYKLCLYFIEVFETQFVHRNHHTLSKYFINFVFYLNSYKDNEMYPVTLETLENNAENYDFSYERRVIVHKFLYSSLERKSQLQILNALNKDYLLPFYNGRIKAASNTLNILRDILSLTCFFVSEHFSGDNFGDIDQLYTALFEDMKKDFFTRKRPCESSDMEFDKSLENLLVSLLKMLYMIEKSNLNMLPQFFSTVGLATRAFYNKIIHMVHDNKTLKDLYYDLEDCYGKYREMVRTEPLDMLQYCDNEEWRLYLGSSAQLIRC